MIDVEVWDVKSGNIFLTIIKWNYAYTHSFFILFFCGIFLNTISLTYIWNLWIFYIYRVHHGWKSHKKFWWQSLSIKHEFLKFHFLSNVQKKKKILRVIREKKFKVVRWNISMNFMQMWIINAHYNFNNS